jgi:hypothetical protein
MPKLLNKVNLPRYSSAPSTPSEADLYYNTSDDKIYVYNGSAWVAVGSGAGGSEIYYQSSEPSSPEDGDIWIDSDDEVASVTSITDSTSTTSSTVAASATAVKSAYDLADGAIPKTLTTTTGDIIYASSANTPARLGIGTADQVLSVAAGVPAWTTPAGGGGMTLIATATPSAATSLEFTSIPTTYKHLKIVYRNVAQSANNVYWGMRFNSNTSTNYPHRAGHTLANGTFTVGAYEAGNYFGGEISASTGAIPPSTNTAGVARQLASGQIDIYRYAELEQRAVIWTSAGYIDTNQNPSWSMCHGVYSESSTAITSIQFIRSSTQTITGTFYLYGVS